MNRMIHSIHFSCSGGVSRIMKFDMNDPLGKAVLKSVVGRVYLRGYNNLECGVWSSINPVMVSIEGAIAEEVRR